jgi:hypothetical protein
MRQQAQLPVCSAGHAPWAMPPNDDLTVAKMYRNALVSHEAIIALLILPDTIQENKSIILML